MNDFKFSDHFPFETARPSQQKACEKIISLIKSGKKVILLDAPTGIGKSAIAYTIASYFNDAYFLTSQKVLQQQYLDSFKMSHDSISSIVGKNNFNCLHDLVLKCDIGKCQTSNKKKCLNCPYILARNAAYAAKNTLLNYKYFLNMSRAEPSPQKKKELMICDEAHHLEKEVYEYLTVDIKMYEFTRHKVNIPLIPKFPDKQKALEWLLKVCRPNLQKQCADLKNSLDDLDKNDPSIVVISKKVIFLDSIIDSISRFNDEVEQKSDFIINQNDNQILFKPLLIKSDRFTGFFFKYADVILLMSATILDYDIYFKYLGVKKEDIGVVRCSSIFPEENNKIYFWNYGSMSMKNRDSNIDKITDLIDSIIEENKGKRGIIHTVTNANANHIIENSKYKHRLILASGRDKSEIVDRFKNRSKPDAILISPSLQEGISLDGELADFSIIVKVPFGNLADEWTKLRMQIDNEWYALNTVRTIVQMVGRHCRSATDVVTTHILDSDFMQLYRSSKRFFPKEWIKQIEK